MGILKKYLTKLKNSNLYVPKDSEPVRPKENKMERFTDTTRNVFGLAQVEAGRLEHEMIGPEHILVGLLQQEGYAQQVLTQAKIEVTLVMAQIELLTASVPKAKEFRSLTDETKRALELAADEAWRLYHPQITTHQLLIGILREEKNLAVKCLQMLDTDTDQLLQESRQHTKAMIKKVGRVEYIQFENTLPAK
ncbi:MAG: ATP-dependent Clp protease ATP-binding subunit [Anaerolineae bacterium]|nr:MAG: ATP-dependent Clp protease ATP-binding subunit [Anaerolineae bacterium]